MSADLTLRCLSSLRKAHPPTYVAMRYMAESLVSAEETGFARSAILRRYITQPVKDYCKVPRFKSIGKDGIPNFRELFIPSPFANLAEAMVLSELAKSPAFGNHPSVYSYLWPSTSSKGKNFEHYFDGYQSRNSAICKAFNKKPNTVALVVDIKSFYPSVPKDEASAEIAKRLQASDLAVDVKEATAACTEQALNAVLGDTGIPIGPEISHLLADLVLRSIDVELFREFTSNYFRYVDDIVLIVNASEVDSALEKLRVLLLRKGLKANEDKVDVVSGEEWIKYGPSGHRDVEEHTFESMVFRVKTFIATKPERMNDLQTALEALGVFLPFPRLRNHAAKLNFRDSLVAFWDEDWEVLRAAFLDNVETHVKYVLAVKRNASNELNRLLARGMPEGSMLRKWFTQDLRRWANQLLYLCSEEELAQVANSIEHFPELYETAQVIRCLISRDVFPLLDIPGQATAAYGSLAITRQVRAKPLISYSLESNLHRESLGTLLLYGAISDAGGIIDQARENEDYFLRFCAGDAAESRELDDFSYLDEIRCLQLGKGTPHPRTILETRFSADEALSFEALQLSGGYGRRER